MQMDKSKLVTLTEAAKYTGTTRQAMYVARQRGDITARKVAHGKRSIWMFEIRDIDDFLVNKYTPHKRKKDDGTKVFDKDKGEYSISQLADKHDVPKMNIYYWVHKGLIPYTRYKTNYIIREKDFTDFYEGMPVKPKFEWE